MSASNRTAFVCDKHPRIKFPTQKSLEQHLKYAPSHAKQEPFQHSLRQQAGPVLGAISVESDERWSSISVSEESELIDSLSEHCHSIKDLLKHRHLLHTYTAEELEGFRQCLTCNSKFCLLALSVV